MKVDVSDSKRVGIFVREVERGISHGKTGLALSCAADLRNEIQAEIRRWARDRTGALESSFGLAMTEKGASVTSDSPYARIHNEGGTIRPVQARGLTIPIDPAAKGTKAEQWPGLVRIGNTLCQPGKFGAALPHPIFVLAKEVQIRPKRYLDRALENSQSGRLKKCARWLGDVARAAARLVGLR